MEINQRARLAHARKATKALARWRWRAVEFAFLAPATYYVLRHFFPTGDTMEHLAVLGLAAVATLVVIPSAEFAAHYFTAPQVIENEQLRTQLEKASAENAALRAIPKAVDEQPPPPKHYVPETASEIKRRLSTLRWSQKDEFVKASYAGRWLRGTGTIERITPRIGGGQNQGFNVSLRDETGPTVFLHCESGKRPMLEPLNEGDKVEYEGCLASDLELGLWLHEATVNRI